MTKNDIVLGRYADDVYYSGYDAHTAIFQQVNRRFVEKFIAALENEGYKKYSDVSFDGESDFKKNYFAIYQSDDMTVNVEHHAYADRMYVTYTPKKDGFVLPSLEKKEYISSSQPTILTQVGTERFHPTAVSMCYIVRAADGSFVLIDSDFGDGMAELIYDILKKQAPDPDNIVISAWFLSHPHTDHVCGFIDFADKYANDKTITLKQVIYNFSDDKYVGSHIVGLMQKTAEAIEKFGKDVTCIRARAGYVMHYADLTFRALYSQENYLVATHGEIEDANSASLVVQMETDSGVKVLFGADHAVRGNYNGLPFCEGALYRWYGDFIKSDILTLFHHGFGGGADDYVYSVVKPKIVLWPATYFRLTHDSDGTPYGDIEHNSRNSYFSDPEQAKKNGVKGYYISGDKIHIVDLSDKELTVTEYETCDAYLK